jgi:hypothetical protein
VVVGFPEQGKAAVIMTNAQFCNKLYSEILVSIATEYVWPHGPLIGNG